MSYRIHSDERLETGLRRIAAEQLDLAQGGFDDPGLDRATAVHEARKCCKRLRALLRLARAGLGDEVYRTENSRLRDAARRLSDLRDAEALIETYAKLDRYFGDRIDRRTIAPVRRALATRREALADDVALERRAAAFREDLAAARDRVSSWPDPANGFGMLAPGLERTYRRGRKAMKAAYAAPSTERFHEWRKRVKYHRYHVELLSELWPKPLETRRREVKALGTLLGDEHDLAVLQAALEAESDRFGADSARALSDLSRIRRDELRSAMRPLGERVFAERSKALARRYEVYWRAWRSAAETKPQPARAA